MLQVAGLNSGIYNLQGTKLFLVLQVAGLNSGTYSLQDTELFLVPQAETYIRSRQLIDGSGYESGYQSQFVLSI